MLRNNYIQLTKALINTLEHFDYTLLSPSINSHELSVIKVAIRSKERKLFLKTLSENIAFQIVQSKLDSTILTTDLSTDEFVTIEIYHFFHVDRLTYLDAKEVMANRKSWDNGLYIPKLEHLLEFSILNSFLNEEGLNDRVIKQFEDLHIFLQEGLLDYFNTKYDTYFNSLYDLVDYKETIANHFSQAIKAIPANKFANRMKLGWVNVKQLFKRSAVFSY